MPSRLGQRKAFNCSGFQQVSSRARKIRIDIGDAETHYRAKGQDGVGLTILLDCLA